MPVHTPFTQDFDALPSTLAVFPLGNALLLPGSHLPLNIFEPRYINMVQDAMRGEQLIGMIQPAERAPVPTLHRTGCAGRIVRYEETLDGRFLIVLAGLCRFDIGAELDCIRGYRLVTPDWQPYKADFDEPEAPQPEILTNLKQLIEKHLKNRKAGFDFSAVERMSPETIVNGAITYLPLAPEDKQLLLEAKTLRDRTVALLAMLQEMQHNDITRH